MRSLDLTRITLHVNFSVSTKIEEKEGKANAENMQTDEIARAVRCIEFTDRIFELVARAVSKELRYGRETKIVGI